MSDIDDLLGVIRSGRDLESLDPRPLRFAVPGVFPEGLTVLAGAPKRGKSWLILDVCLAIAAGGKALGAIDVIPGRTLYLALEDSDRRLQARGRHLLGGRPFPAMFSYATSLPDPGRLIKMLETFCATHTDTRIIAIDTLARVRPPQPKHRQAYEWDYAVGAALKKVADEYRVSLVAVTHTRQLAAADFVEAVSGTSGLTGAADTIVVLDRARGQDDGVLRVTGRDVDEAEYALRMVGGAWQLLDRPPVDPALSDRSVKVLDFVAGRGRVRADDVAAGLRLDLQTARTYLALLVDSGRLERPERGVYVAPRTGPLVHPRVVSVATVASPPLNNTHNTHITQVHTGGAA